MASISNDPNGRRRIQFFDASGQRRTIRLGKVPLRYAEAVKVKVEDLAYAATTGHAPAEETSRWLAKLDAELYDKLAKVGLAKQRGVTTLGAFTRSYIDGRADIKPSSRVNMERARSYLLEHFDERIPMRDISEGDAEGFQQHMVRSGRADNTIRKAVGRIRQFFNAAKRHGLVHANAFDVLPASMKTNHERFFFITRDMVDRTLAHCPDNQWRLIVLLARYGGLRCPSEVLALTWADVNWEHNRIRVPSPKTEHHQGGASRMIPLFPELRPVLLEAFSEADTGSEHVITRYRDTNANLRTQFNRIIRRAGYEPWPKLFQNLRSTRETELAESFPMHVVCKWIGNSQPVAAAHYLQLTDDHFERAVGATVGAETAQKAAQKPTEAVGKQPKREPTKAPESVDASEHIADVPVASEPFGSGKVPVVGVEPTRGI